MTESYRGDKATANKRFSEMISKYNLPVLSGRDAKEFILAFREHTKGKSLSGKRKQSRE